MKVLVDSILSFHYFPSVALSALALALYATHHTSLAVLFLLASVALVALLRRVLPSITIRPLGGRYHVGRRTVDGNSQQGMPPLTLFYPTLVPPPPGGIAWLPDEDDAAHYTGGLAAYGKVPAFVLADMRWTRLAASAQSPPLPLFNDDSTTPRPVVLFSHGLGAFASFYSALLSDMAARGALVIAMTHTDASAAYCRVRAGEGIPLDATKRWVPEDREPQLVHRVAETRRVLRRITSGELLRAMGCEEEEVRRYVSAGVRVTLVGHSFGGATALMTALEVGHDHGNSGKDGLHDRQADGLISSVVVFDPWHIPLQRDLFRGPIVAGAKHYATPTLEFQSGEWMQWKSSWEFFLRLHSELLTQQFSKEEAQRIAAAGRAPSEMMSLAAGGMWYIVAKSSSAVHTTYSDLSLLLRTFFSMRFGFKTRSPRPLIAEWATDAVNFLTLHTRRDADEANRAAA